MGTLIFKIGDIHCVGCINRINSALALDGVIDVDVNLSTHITKVITEENDPNPDVYTNAIKNAGYQVEYLTTIID